MINLKNLVIYISGSNGKIGFSISKHILKYGGKLVLGDINIKKCKTLQKKFGNKNIIIIKGDHTKSKTIEKTLKTTKKKFGKIDAAINCAYPHTKDWGTPFEKLKKQSLNKNINFQLGGTIIFSQKLMNFFKKQKKGNLILISSILGTNAPKFFQYKNLKMNSPIEYSAVKAGIIAITKYLAEFYKKKNIRVNCISPGGIISNQPKFFKSRYKKLCASKGLLVAEDLNEILSYLISDQSKYVNGQNFVIDDGWSL